MTRRIFCGNLNFNTNAQALGELFETVGVVQHVTIMSRCDKSLGYGFVEMESDTQAQRAVSALNGRELDGRKLVVELDVAKDNSDDPTVLQKLPDDLLIYNDFQQRRSIRRYTSQDIPDPVIQRILSNVINNVPTAGNLQAYHVLVIRNPETKEKLAHASHSQPQVKSCQVLLVFLANPRASEEKYKARGRDLYCIQDSTNAAMMASLAIASEGLGSCWVGAFDEKQVAEILHCGDSYRPVVMLTLGYPNEVREPSKRKSFKEMVSFEKL